MKQLIIFLLLVIIFIIGYGKYSNYKRYNSPEVDYKAKKAIDVNYHNKEILFNYYESIEDLNSYIMLKWTVNGIDVRTPEDDDTATENAVKNYSKKLGKIQFYETLLNKSLQLKEQGLTNKEIKFLEDNGIELATYKKNQRVEKIKKLFNSNVKLYNGSKNAIIYEVQKELNKKGQEITIDGVYRIETFNAIKKFETDNNLLADGYLDDLTLELLFQ
ncbi:peptidoglycan-binding domain-containing protein [Polaribacter porphyrae]|uniref:Peptidoglycan binding-like domain-containing protein n=1 Tax=Polaribacter porphyrae TaxID=1137780 RepID=A0A2S7WLJ9_9FLAO|nr:peptidoglycan-binding domain-containing protein [Polaribacter porphyrae]PQJ78469.1 hypothetical protein BTO18_04360 [Polaribacter porphyrae]